VLEQDPETEDRHPTLRPWLAVKNVVRTPARSSLPEVRIHARRAAAEDRAAAARVSSGLTQFGVAPWQSVGQLPPAVDSELSKYLSQVPLHGARAEEQSSRDLPV
jgi:hypothetical protein